MNSPELKLQPRVHAPAAPTLEELRAFIELEAELLDEQQFKDWLELYADDAVYWVPATRDQVDWQSHVSVFYDDKTILRTRVARLSHHAIHCQDPPSICVRVVSNLKVIASAPETEGGLHVVTSRFIMLEDRIGAPRRVFGGRYRHVLRMAGDGLRIVQKRVDLTNCDQSFSMLTQPF